MAKYISLWFRYLLETLNCFYIGLFTLHLKSTACKILPFCIEYMVNFLCKYSFKWLKIKKNLAQDHNCYCKMLGPPPPPPPYHHHHHHLHHHHHHHHRNVTKQMFLLVLKLHQILFTFVHRAWFILTDHCEHQWYNNLIYNSSEQIY